MTLLIVFGLIAVFGLGPLITLLAIRRRVSAVTYIKCIIGAVVSQLFAVYAILGVALYEKPDQPLLPGVLFGAFMTLYGLGTIRASLRDLAAAKTSKTK